MVDLLPFLTVPIDHPDFNDADLHAEHERFIQRQRVIAHVIDGELPYDVLLDMLMEHGIDPHAWVDVATDNINFLMGG